MGCGVRVDECGPPPEPLPPRPGASPARRTGRLTPLRKPQCALRPLRPSDSGTAHPVHQHLRGWIDNRRRACQIEQVSGSKPRCCCWRGGGSAVHLPHPPPPPPGTCAKTPLISVVLILV